MESKHDFNKEILDNKNESENLSNSSASFTPDKLIKLIDVSKKVEDGEKLQINDLIFLNENIDDIEKIASGRWISVEKTLDSDEIWNKIKNGEILSDDEINNRNNLIRAQQRETVEKMIKKNESGEKDVTDRLYEIDGKIIDGKELSKEELILIYEPDTRKRFGDSIERYKSKRDISSDYAKILDLNPEDVTNDKSKISGETKVYIGNLGPNDYHIFEHIKNGIIIYGETNLRGHNSSSPIKIHPNTVFKEDAIFENCNFRSQHDFPKELMFEGDLIFRNCHLTNFQKSSLLRLKEAGNIKGELKIYEESPPKKDKVYSYAKI
jgi:hypothetical protein